MSSKKRLDIWLLEQGLALSRSHAQELIDSSQVVLTDNGKKQILKKPSYSVDETVAEKISVEDGPANRFVSRGGLKLEGALQTVKLSVEGLNVLDVGISTGGFTDCLLQKGAATVLGVDVGHGQVSPKLMGHPKLQVLEGINARNLASLPEVLEKTPPAKFDLAVMDVSFISISLIVPQLSSLIKTEGYLLSLVKPQFEVGVDGLSKGGIVKDKSLYAELEERIKLLCTDSGFKVIEYFSSPIQGKDGNNEFFVFAKKI